MTSKTAPHREPTAKRSRTPRRRALISRLEQLLEQQVAALERGDTDQGPEKEIALLGTLARTLEKLIELDSSQTPAKVAKPRETAEMAELRKKLSDRIQSLELE